jgi:AraC-like DNA-binding protein
VDSSSLGGVVEHFQIALGWLKETGRSLAPIAEKLAYESDASFNRSFKKFKGKTSGAVRRPLKSFNIAQKPLVTKQ